MDRLDLLVRDDFMPRESVEKLLSHLPRLLPAKDSLFYVPVAETPGIEREKELDSYFGEGTGAILLRHIAKTLAIIGPQTIVEMFFRGSDGVSTSHYGSLPSGKGMFHRDHSGWPKEEELREEVQYTPTYSTILFLSPDEMDEIDGSTYVFLDRTPEVFAQSLTMMTVAEAIKISPSYGRVALKAGRTAIFDGSCAHLVTPFPALPEGVLRVTLLLNFWKHGPTVGAPWVRNPGGINLIQTPREYELMVRLGRGVYPFINECMRRLRGCTPQEQDELVELLKAYARSPADVTFPWGSDLPSVGTKITDS